MKNYLQVPPNDKEVEKVVLGRLLLEANLIAQISEIIPSSECFYQKENKSIFEAIRSLYGKGMQIDIITVCEELKKKGELEAIGGAYYVTSLIKDVTGYGNIEEYCLLLAEYYNRRRIIEICSIAQLKAYDLTKDIFENMNQVSLDVTNLTVKKSNITKIDESIFTVIENIDKIMSGVESYTGISTGLKSIDVVTNGWGNGELDIIAARPSMGKSILAINTASNAALSGLSVLLLSLEMSIQKITQRILSYWTKIPIWKIRKAELTDEERLTLDKAYERFLTVNLFIDDIALVTVDEIASKAYRMKQKKGLDLLVIDYIQLINCIDSKNKNREQDVSSITRRLKILAKELNIPIIALSQLSRAAEGIEPNLSHLRESGAIEQDADQVLFIYAPDATSPNRAIKIAKNREGEKDRKVPISALLDTQTFADYNDYQQNYF